MKPLEGVTVLDLTRVVAGPYCTMILADLGARVIKIENPSDPDYTRDFEPFLVDGDRKQSGFFAQYNRNKEAITLNLKAPEAKEMLKEMVKKADILVENYRAGIMDKLGVGYSVLKEVNPKLVYTAISGFGQGGPTPRGRPTTTAARPSAACGPSMVCPASPLVWAPLSAIWPPPSSVPSVLWPPISTRRIPARARWWTWPSWIPPWR